MYHHVFVKKNKHLNFLNPLHIENKNQSIFIMWRILVLSLMSLLCHVWMNECASFKLCVLEMTYVFQIKYFTNSLKKLNFVLRNVNHFLPKISWSLIYFILEFRFIEIKSNLSSCPLIALLETFQLLQTFL